jgi:enamine deaminase RidA (YjgF/YER057c/UK114 family)
LIEQKLIEQKLLELGIELPDVPPLPMAPNRAIVAVHDQLAFVSGVGPIGVTGIVGADLDVAAGYDAARTAALYCLSRLRQELGSLEVVARWVKVLGFVRSAPGFGRQPEVLNGFSDLVGELWGDAGRAARSAIGVSELPLNMPVEVEAVVLLH